MSKLLYKTEQVGDFASGTVDVIGHVICDTTADLPTSTEFQTDGVTLLMGSTADIIQDGTRYKMDSSGTWVQQPSEFQLDLTSYYTSAQTDAAIAAALSSYPTYTDVTNEITLAMTNVYQLDTWQEIPNNTDLLTLPIGRYVKVTGLNTLVNRPTGYTGGILLIVERIGNNSTPNGRRRITLFPISESFNTVSHYCILENATTPNTWGSWVRFDGGTVL